MRFASCAATAITLCFAVLSPAAQLTVQDNVRSYLTMIGISHSTIAVVGTATDGHSLFANPADCANDQLAASLRADPNWRREPGPIARWYHGTPYGWRYHLNPSLHVHIAYNGRSSPCGYSYEIDVDQYCAAFGSPFSLIAHLGFEVAPHNIFRSTTSQIRVGRGIARLRDRKAWRGHSDSN